MSERFARIDQASDWLATWLAEAAGATVPIRVPASDDTGGKGALGCVLIGLGATAPAPRAAIPRFLARFLIWASPTDATAQRRLTGIVFAAMAERHWLEVDFMPDQALIGAVAPGRVCLGLAIPIEAVPPTRKDRLVTEPLVLRRALMGELSGIVLADGEQPLARADVTIPALSLATATDAHGRFRFAGVPADAEAEIVVRARGRELVVTAETSPLTIDFPIEKG